MPRGKALSNKNCPENKMIHALKGVVESNIHPPSLHRVSCEVISDGAGRDSTGTLAISFGERKRRKWSYTVSTGPE